MNSKNGISIMLIIIMLSIFLSLFADTNTETVVATYKGGKITKKEFKRQLNELPGFYRAKINTDKDKEDFLDQLVVRKIFYLEAKNNGYEDSLSVLLDIADKTKSYLSREYKKRYVTSKIKITNKEKQKYFIEHSKDKAIFGKTFKEVADYIEKKLLPEKRKELEEKEQKRLEKEYNVTYNTNVIKKINLDDLDANNDIKNELVVKSPNEDLQKTVADFLKAYKKMPAFRKDAVKKDGIEKFIKELTKQELFYLEALKEGLDKNPEIAKTIERYKENTVLQHFYKNIVTNTIPQTDNDIKKYYDEHLNQFSTRAERKIRAFYFKDEKAAKKIRKKVAKLLKKGKEKKIVELLKKYSIHPEKEGVIEHIYKNDIVPGFGKDKVFFDNIWKLQKNSVSPVFKNSKGDYTFCYILKEEPSKPMDFAEIKDRVKSMMMRTLAKEKFEAVKKDFYKKYDVKIFKDKLPDILPAKEYFTKAMNAQNHKRYKDAIFYYDKIIKYYKNNKDDYKALFMKAYIYSEDLDDKEKALALFKKVISDYPKSDLHDSAKFMIDELEGKTSMEKDFLNK